MLDELRVENLGIIQEATIEPGSGLVAVTGETGAGKTLLLGALRLLRGDTARLDRVGPHGDEAKVEGRFVIDGSEVIASRRLQAGRSRAYLDSAMVAAGALTERFGGVVEIVAQHEHVALGREGTLRKLVDGILDESALAARQRYRDAYKALREVEAEAEALGGDPEALERDLDLLLHQAGEVERARLAPDEETELTIRLRRLRHAGEIGTALGIALDALDGEDRAVDLVRSALEQSRAAAKLDDGFEALTGQIEGAIAGIEEIVADIRDSLGDLEHEPGALAEAEERAAVIGDLKRKYGATIEEVIDYADSARARAAEIEQRLKRLTTIGADVQKARDTAEAEGRTLATARREAAQVLAGRAEERLKRLGFNDPLLELTVEDADPGPQGADRLALSFASDRSLTPGPISKIASGGELSRLVLALQVSAGIADAPIVAFDEVDAGVGGATALAMGEELAALARDGQVLVVTHLPQVAAFADSHFVVERSATSASVRRVDGPERLAELARMLGGIEESERGQLHAEELVAVARERRGD